MPGASAATGKMRVNQFPPDYDGWLGSFTVPEDSPQNPPAVLYIFTGLQNIDWIPLVDPVPSQVFDIIQPVLQYPGDFGYYWSVKSWYVTLDMGAIASAEIQLPVGDTIFGNMTMTAANTWYIGSTSAAMGQTTEITVTQPRLKSQPWAYNTLECYGCGDCSLYPTTPSLFTGLAITSRGRTVTPKWRVNPKPSPNHYCNEMISVNDPTSVTISFT